MEEFLPHFVDADLKLPTSFTQSFQLLWGLIKFDYTWEDIQYEVPRLDIAETDVEIMQYKDFPHTIKLYFPLVDFWRISAHQIQKHWLLNHESDVALYFWDLVFEFEFGFRVDSMHYLDPIVYNCAIDFGDSFLYHNNRFVAFAMHQVVKLFLIVVENTCRFSHIGAFIYGDLLGPGMDKWLNNYQLEFRDVESMMAGQDATDSFRFDLRQVRDPIIDDGHADFFMHGAMEIFGDAEYCTLDPDDLVFVEDKESEAYWSQVIMSESMATCFLNKYYSSELGKVHLDSKSVKAFAYDGSATEFTTSSLSNHLPLFENKMGKNKPLKMDLGFRDFGLDFWHEDVDGFVDIAVTYTMDMEVSADDIGFEGVVFRDEFRMYSTMNAQVDRDRVYLYMFENELDLDPEYGQFTAPREDMLGTTESEYREFISDFGFFLNYIRKYLNNVHFQDGLQLPWTADEIEFDLQFEEQQMHVFIDLTDDADRWFEQEFWDDDFEKDWEAGDVDEDYWKAEEGWDSVDGWEGFDETPHFYDGDDWATDADDWGTGDFQRSEYTATNTTETKNST